MSEVKDTEIILEGAQRIHVDDLIAWLQKTREQMGNTGLIFDFLANGCKALWYQEYAKKLFALLPPGKVQLEPGWPETDHVYARAAAKIERLRARDDLMQSVTAAASELATGDAPRDEQGYCVYCGNLDSIPHHEKCLYDKRWCAVRAYKESKGK